MLGSLKLTALGRGLTGSRADLCPFGGPKTPDVNPSYFLSGLEQLHGSLPLLPDPLLAALNNTYVAVLNV